MKLTGAQIILESLIQQDATLIFGYPGGAILPTYDALWDYRDRIKHVLVRHEENAALAADFRRSAQHRATDRGGFRPGDDRNARPLRQQRHPQFALRLLHAWKCCRQDPTLHGKPVQRANDSSDR